MDSFLNILELYLKSTTVEFKWKTYMRREGGCIRSPIAALFSEIYLNQLDKRITQFLQTMLEDVVLNKRYVDDILVCSKKSGLLPKVDVTISAAPDGVHL